MSKASGCISQIVHRHVQVLHGRSNERVRYQTEPEFEDADASACFRVGASRAIRSPHVAAELLPELPGVEPDYQAIEAF
jgi:hypothetical protein